MSAFASQKEGFKLIRAGELHHWMEQKAPKLAIFDANNAETRQKDGVIPGAQLLDSVMKYDVAKTLPAAKDSKLVFYCANTKCMASHMAAQRAVEAGYSDVSVMSDGIQGWKAAGMTTAKP